jgi:hypothetical protein
MNNIIWLVGAVVDCSASEPVIAVRLLKSCACAQMRGRMCLPPLTSDLVSKSVSA